MSFTSALFLYGSLLALIPIIIHLIFRRQSRVVQFPSLMFFRLISKRIARKQNIREWIILILRFLTILLISFALANPILSAFNINSGSTSAVVIIIDDSYSMNYESKSETLFERAKQQAFDVLSTLKSGDMAEIVFTSESNDMSGKNLLTYDIENLKQKILLTKGTNNSNSLKHAFDISIELLSNSQMPNKECYIISDFREPAIRDAIQKLPNDKLKIFSIPINCESFESFAIANVEIMNPNVIYNTKSRIKVTVQNFLGAEKKVQISLYIQQFSEDMKSAKYVENEDVQELVFAINDYEKSAYFEVFTTESDVLSGYVALNVINIDEKDLEADNRRYFSVNIGTKKDVIVINGEPNEISFDDEVFYLRAALEAQDIYNFHESNELELINFDRYYAIFLCNTNMLDSNDSYNKLSEYVEDGGILILFPGDNVDSSDFNAFFKREDPQNSIVPANLDKIITSNSKLSIKPFSDNTPLHSNLSELDTSKVSIDTYWRLKCTTQDIDTNIHAKFTNDDIYFCSKKKGLGRVYFFAIPADREWTNLPPRKLFPVLIHQLLEDRTFKDINILPCEMFKTSITNKLGKIQIQVLTPTHINDSESEIILNPTYLMSTGGENNSFEFPTNIANSGFTRINDPGTYFYKINPSDPTSKYFAFNVNPDTIEANPKIASLKQIRDAIPNGEILADDSNIAESIRKRREGTSIWLIFAISCLIAFILESLLANHKLPIKLDEKMQK